MVTLPTVCTGALNISEEFITAKWAFLGEGLKQDRYENDRMRKTRALREADYFFLNLN